MAGSLVLVNDAFVGHTVYDRDRMVISFLGSSSVTGGDSRIYFLDYGANQGTQAGVMVASLFRLAGALPS